jgi:hypothetical protein
VLVSCNAGGLGVTTPEEAAETAWSGWCGAHGVGGIVGI